MVEILAGKILLGSHSCRKILVCMTNLAGKVWLVVKILQEILKGKSCGNNLAGNVLVGNSCGT